MGVAALVCAALAAAAGPQVQLRPFKKITVLPIQQCEVEVRFRLTVSDGNVEDYYCPRVVWEWEDGSLSSEETECLPFEEAAPSDHRRSWMRSRDFQGSGRYLIRAHLCRGPRRVATVETTAVVSGWAGYPEERRQEAGCSPPRLRPIPPPPTPDPRTGDRIDERPMLGMPHDDRMQQAVRPLEPRDVCRLTSQ